MEIIRAVNLPNIKLLLDYFHAILGGDTLEQLATYGDDIVHVHLASPINERSVPRENDLEDCRKFFAMLNSIGYKGAVAPGPTMQGTDVLFPSIGEIIGGSVREESYDKLMAEVNRRDMDMTHLWWYLDTRKYGSCPHAGFGLGFERLILFVTGMQNIRDVIPFPRTPKNAEF